MDIKTFFDERTFTLTYVVHDADSADCVIIDPVLDYDPVGSKIWNESAQEVVEFVRDKGLRPHYILETHAHADHLSGSRLLKKHFPQAKVGIGRRITEVQSTFKQVFALPADFPEDGSQFDELFDDNQTVRAGTLEFSVMYTPGHTPACASYLIGDALFTGDALFMPDMGTGRCDFPGGSAMDLYHSIHDRIYELDGSTRIFVGHDYQPGGRELKYQTTVDEQKQDNIQLKADTTLEKFMEFRTARDKTLNAPKLLFQSIQVNIDAGAMPKADDAQRRYLKIPLNVFAPGEEDNLLLEAI